MKTPKRRYITLVLAVAVVLSLICLRTPSVSSWKHITVSFGGFTNCAGVKSVALCIQNPTSRPIKVMDHYYVETPEVSTYTGNTIGAGRSLAVGTNLTVAAGQTGVLHIPVPSNGNRWKVSLEFARANLQTRFAEYLQQPSNSLAKYVPHQIRGVYVVRRAGCEFSVDAKQTNN